MVPSVLYLLTAAITVTAVPLDDAFFQQLVKRYNDQAGDWTGNTSSYADGSGSYLKSVDVDHYGRLGGGTKCWTDVFYNNEDYKQSNWSKLQASSIDCGSTNSCMSGIQNTSTQCSQWTLGGTVSVDSADGSPGWLGSLFNAGVSAEASGGQSTCNSAIATGTCTWNDQKCHSVWTSTMYLVKHGYIRRRCDFKDGRGDVTVWSKDWQLAEPTPHASIGCNAACSDITYPGGVPSLPAEGPETAILAARLMQSNMTSLNLTNPFRALNGSLGGNSTIQLADLARASNATGSGNATALAAGPGGSNSTSLLADESVPGNSTTSRVISEGGAGNHSSPILETDSGASNSSSSSHVPLTTGIAHPASSKDAQDPSQASNITSLHEQSTSKTLPHEGSLEDPASNSTETHDPTEAGSADNATEPAATSSSRARHHGAGNAASSTDLSAGVESSAASSVDTPSSTRTAPFATFTAGRNATRSRAEGGERATTVISKPVRATEAKSRGGNREEGGRGRHGGQ